MANIAGSLRAGISDAIRASTTSAGWPIPGAVRPLVVTIGDDPPIYKNQGWYAAGSTYETWISVGTWSTFNPATGHGLAHLSQLQHQLVSE